MLGSWMDSHLIISSCAHSKFLHPGSGRFCPLNSQKHVTVPAPSSKFDASRLPEAKKTNVRQNRSRASFNPACPSDRSKSRPDILCLKEGDTHSIFVQLIDVKRIWVLNPTLSYVFIIIACVNSKQYQKMYCKCNVNGKRECKPTCQCNAMYIFCLTHLV